MAPLSAGQRLVAIPSLGVNHPTDALYGVTRAGQGDHGRQDHAGKPSDLRHNHGRAGSVVKWISRTPPKGQVQVRFLSGPPPFLRASQKPQPLRSCLKCTFHPNPTRLSPYEMALRVNSNGL